MNKLEASDMSWLYLKNLTSVQKKDLKDSKKVKKIEPSTELKDKPKNAFDEALEKAKEKNEKEEEKKYFNY